MNIINNLDNKLFSNLSINYDENKKSEIINNALKHYVPTPHLIKVDHYSFNWQSMKWSFLSYASACLIIIVMLGGIELLENMINNTTKVNGKRQNQIVLSGKRENSEKDKIAGDITKTDTIVLSSGDANNSDSREGKDSGGNLSGGENSRGEKTISRSLAGQDITGEPGNQFTTDNRFESVLPARTPVASPPVEKGIVISNQDIPNSNNSAAAAGDKIIYNVNAIYRVDSARVSLELLSSKCTQLGGFIANSNRSHNGDGFSSVYLNINIPVNEQDKFNEILREIGYEINYNAYQQNVSKAYIETEEQIKNKELLLERIRKLASSKTERINDLLSVEQELNRITNELESYKNTLKSYTDQTSYAHYSLTLQESGFNQSGANLDTFDTQMKVFFQSLLNTMKSVANILAHGIALIIPLFLVGLPIYFIIRKKVLKIKTKKDM